jgi:hypothetical protein
MNLDQFSKQAESEEVKNWVNHNLRNYINKNADNLLEVAEIEHIIDYLNSDKAPKRLRKMSYEEANNSAKIWMESMIKKASGIVETEEDTEIIKAYNNGLRFVRLKGENAFKREGNLMSHCVSSYYGKDGVEVYSLRDGNNNPHCTIEVQSSNNTVNQIKGKGNGSIHPKYVEPILDILKNHFKLDVRESEMTNLGYDKLSEDMFNFIQSNFSGMKFITFNGSNFLYKNSNLKRKETV